MTQEQSIASTTELASVTEPVSPIEPSKVVEPTVQPLAPEIEARIQQLLAEATQKAIEQGKSLGRREMQAIKDKEVADVKRRADLAERRAKSYEGSLTDLDEDTRARVEQQKTKGELEFYKTKEQEEESRKQQEVYFTRLNQSIRDEVTVLGIDPSDSRIDYATDANDYFEGRKRFSESLAKIVKADKDTLEKTLVQKAEDRFKQMETDFRKQHGLDSQDTTASRGVVNQSDADFMADWGNYKLPDNKENRARYEAIKKKYY